MPDILLVLKVPDFALSLVEAGTAAFEILLQRRNQIRAMVAEGRDPTPAEWDALFDTIAGRTAHVLHRAP